MKHFSQKQKEGTKFTYIIWKGHTQRPNVWFETIRNIRKELRTHIIGSPNHLLIWIQNNYYFPDSDANNYDLLHYGITIYVDPLVKL